MPLRTQARAAGMCQWSARRNRRRVEIALLPHLAQIGVKRGIRQLWQMRLSRLRGLFFFTSQAATQATFLKPLTKSRRLRATLATHSDEAHLDAGVAPCRRPTPRVSA